ncbi:aminomethyl-transferring glycine dehydrogenase subunit GcvPB [Candidatus Zixiibacteriota bacterium]
MVTEIEKNVFELSKSGRVGQLPPAAGVPEKPLSELIPPELQRAKSAALPEIAEPQLVRHYTRLSTFNHHVDKAIYPLGSCTMKYNPKINDQVAALPGFAFLHPELPEKHCQGALRLLYELARDLAVIAGMDEVSLQPVAGAQGEMVGLLIIRAYHRKNDQPRKKIIIPDSSHGTNPASVMLTGFEAVPLKSGADGLVDPAALAEVLDENTAGLMLTNPNTLGLFEKEIEKITAMVHEAGGLVYMDGANLNAMLGLVRPGDMGFDIVHFNLHKTFSTPHGGGGPGAGAVGVTTELAEFLPTPRIACVKVNGDKFYRREDVGKYSIGRVHSFDGNFGIMVRAYAYIRTLGPEGLRRVAENAILNANYLASQLIDHYDLPYPLPCQHEFVLSANRQKKQGVRAGEIGKRLLDFGVHAPTVYFPLIVPEALMIEPTETESKESLDRFAEILIQIAGEAQTDPDLVNSAPHTTPILRLDEAKAAKDLDLCWPEETE